MKIRTCAALLLAVGLPTAVFAVDFPEIEPNETKAQASTNGAFTLAAGDAVTGTTTGSSTTTAGAASADTFLIKTTPAALGIYRHRLVITTTGTAGHVGTIRGLSAGGTGVGTLDNAMQTSSTVTTPARYNQWYGFGKQEQLYFRVAGTTATTAAYRAELSTTVVTPAAAASNAESGTITISDATSATTAPYDNDMFLFDSNFNPIVGMDDPDSLGMVASLTPGTYYVAFGTFNTAAGRLAGAVTAPAVGGIQGTFQTGSVLDFNDLVTTSRTTTTTTIPTSISIAAPNGSQTVPGNIIGWGEVQWFTFNVVAAVTPTNPTGTGLASPASVINDGTGVTTLRVTVTPGANPTSTFLTTGTVTVNGASIGAGTVTLLDNGVAPDLVAGDLIFSANATVANGTPAGAATLPFTITDDQARNGSGNIALTITTPPPGCSAGLASLSFNNVSSNDAAGASGNSIVTGDFGVAGQINQLIISGRVTAFSPSYRSEASVRATAPDGSIYNFSFGLPSSSGTSDVVNFPVTFAPEAGTGTWTFEFFESFNDTGINPDATWQAICFTAAQVSTPITATDVATPASIVRDGVASTTLSVTVTPGAVPASTGLDVVVDASTVGGSSTLALLDDGNAPDLVAGDNIFTGTTTVAYTTALGTATLPFTVSDDQSRTFNGSLNFTVTEASGACCLPDGGGCVVTTIGDCLDVQSGTFAGTGTACFGAPFSGELTTEGAGAFEDIAATGTAVTFGTTDDSVATVALPFNFSYFGNTYNSINVVTNGFAQFTGTSTAFSNGTLPSVGTPNNALYPLWDDMNLFGTGTVRTELLGTIGVDARFIIQWNVGQYSGFEVAPADLSVFQIALFEDGNFEFRYQSVSAEGGSAGATDTTTIGFEDISGTFAFQSAETRTTLEFATPISFRGSGNATATGICGPVCPPCAADYDGNGGVDGGDLAAFFADFEAGTGCADVDNNGGVDGGDLAFFFSVFENGGC